MENEKKDYIEIDLLKLLKVLFRKAYIILLSAVLVGGIVFYQYAYRTAPIYQSDAYIYVNNSSLSFVGGKFSISPGEIDAAQSLVDIYAFIAKSRTTLNDVIMRANLDYSYEQLRSMISAGAVDSMEILRISVRSTDPVESEYIANTIADVLPEAISKIVDGSSVRIIDYAVIPHHKVAPDITRNTLLGMIFGAVISSGIILVFALTNDKIKDKGVLLNEYDIPLLATIPRFESKSKRGYGDSYSKIAKRRSEEPLESSRAKATLSFEAVEAYNLLRANLLLSLPNSASSIIGVTSSIPGEGKSTTAVNLADSLARIGKQVAIVELDMRLPTFTQFFDVNKTPGFSNCALGLVSLDEVTQASDRYDNLKVITSGSIPPNPSEILSSEHIPVIVEELKKKYDYVIVDLPPINAVSDALLVSKYTDGMVVVAKYDYVKQRELNEALRQLKVSDTKIIGFIFNEYSNQEKVYRRKYGGKYGKKYGKYGYKYGYGYGYKRSYSSSYAAQPTRVEAQTATGSRMKRKQQAK